MQMKRKQVENIRNAKYRKNNQPRAISVPTSKLGCFCECLWSLGVSVGFTEAAD